MVFGLFKKKDKKAEEPEKDAEPVQKTESVEETKAESKPEVEEETADSAKKSNGAYFVSPHPDGGWQVKKANAQKALKRFDTKAEAEKYAKQVARNQGSNVVRQKKDGKIQKKHRYRPRRRMGFFPDRSLQGPSRRSFDVQWNVLYHAHQITRAMTKLKVRDLMTTEVLTFRPNDTVKKAATKLALENVSGAPIVDNKNHLLGFVSENDILTVIMKYQSRMDKEDIDGSLLEYSMDALDEPDDKLKKASEEISNIEMSSLMVRSVMTTSPDAPIMEVLRTMLKMGINRIPVLEKGVLVGIISRGDIIFALYKKKV